MVCLDFFEDEFAMGDGRNHQLMFDVDTGKMIIELTVPVKHQKEM